MICSVAWKPVWVMGELASGAKVLTASLAQIRNIEGQLLFPLNLILSQCMVNWLLGLPLYGDLTF